MGHLHQRRRGSGALHNGSLEMTKYQRTLLFVEATRIDHLPAALFDPSVAAFEASTGYSFNRLSRTRSRRLFKPAAIGVRLAQLTVRGERQQ